MSNKIIFRLADNTEIEQLTLEEQTLLDKFPLTIKGDNNIVRIKLHERNDIQSFLEREGLFILVVGFNNTVDIGNIFYAVNPRLGITGLQIYIGGEPAFIEPDKLRYASNCKISIGDNTIFCGTRIYLQDDNSSVAIGKDSMFSWGIDVWCTDVHTITDLDGNPINYGHSIEIGNHVWVGKDVKIGKNTKISDDSIVGWGSIVTRKFEDKNVIIAGNPAKIIKTGINWDARDLQNYKLYKQGEK